MAQPHPRRRGRGHRLLQPQDYVAVAFAWPRKVAQTSNLAGPPSGVALDDRSYCCLIVENAALIQSRAGENPMTDISADLQQELDQLQSAYRRLWTIGQLGGGDP
jgi:hypothetical protein